MPFIKVLKQDHGSILQCWSHGHPACLPDCVGGDPDSSSEDSSTDCEFKDNFFHVSNWDIPEDEPGYWPD